MPFLWLFTFFSMYFQKKPPIETSLYHKPQAHLEIFLEFEGAMVKVIALGRKFWIIDGRHSELDP